MHADEALTAFIAGCHRRMFKGVELAMFDFYQANPDGRFRPEAEAAIESYRRGAGDGSA